MNEAAFEKLSASRVSEFPEEWYDLGHAEHFWLRWRIQALKRLLSDSGIPLDQPLHALEVGCGTGVLRAQVEAISQWTIDGADLNEHALVNRIPARGRTLLYDVCEERPELLASYDVVVAFDVLEHVPDVERFVRSSVRHLKPGGWLIVNVPALMMLFSMYDRMVGHLRRYTPESLRREIRAASEDLVPHDIRYWGLSLVPLALARRAVLARRTNPQDIVRTGFHPPARWINSALKLLMNAETALVDRPFVGTSVMGVFRLSQ
jgi:SAM-dependent methyltransferase